MERRQSLGLPGRMSPIHFLSRARTRENIDFYEHWEEDLDLLLEHTAFRTPLSSGHVFSQKDEEINQAGDFYRRVFERLKKRDSPLVNLYHFDLPMALQEQGMV